MTVFETIAEQLGGRLVRAWPLEGGVSAATSAVEVAIGGEVRRFVVRQPGGHYRRDVGERDFRLMQALADAGLPVARPRLLDPTGERLGEPALVLDYLAGETDPRRDVDRATLEALARQLAAIHAIPEPQGFTHLLPDLRALAIPFVARRPEQPDESLGESEVRAALARMPQPPRANPDVVLHGDFWPGNVLWRHGEISGVVDWEDAAIGDPLYDLAITRLDVLWTYGPGAPELFTQAYAHAAPQVDLAPLAWFDLGACLRPAGQISVWSTAAADPVAHARTMRERHAWFRGQALDAFERLAG
jgi:aminoglycoside phosphotransferase (APT) family kinase protein